MAQAIYIRKDGVRGTLVDSTGAVRGGLQFSVTLGMAAEISIKIYDGEKDAFLTQTELARYAAFNFVLADDFNQTTDPQIRVNTGITVGADGAINVTIPNTNTEGLATWLGQKAQDTIGVELACYEAGEETPTMVLQWTCVVYNRRDLEGGEPTAPTDPEYLTAAQVYALMSAGVEMQYSEDATNWHSTQTTSDRYLRFRTLGTENAEWSPAVMQAAWGDLEYTDIFTSSAASLAISPAKCVVWTPSGDGTLSATGGVAGKRSYACVDIVLGASNVVTLSGISWASQSDVLKANTTNRCVVIFDGTSATLAVCEATETSGGGGGGGVVVDTELSATSPNPVANSTLYNALNGKSPAPIIASTAPTTSTEGAVGQLYVDTATSKTYHCTAVTTDDTDPENPVTTYTWTDDINANGGILNNGLFYKTTSNGKGYQFLLQAESVGTNLILSNISGIRLGGDPPAVMPISYSNCNLFAGFGFVFEGDYLYYISNNLIFGNYMNICKNSKQMLVMGNYNVGRTQAQRIISRGTGLNARRNIEELSDNGDHYITGGHQQGITVIPAATSAYTLAEGCFEHIPSSAPTYTLPAIMPVIVVDGWAFKRDTSLDGTGYFGWNTDYTKRYTASATPAVGDNAYTNTALTSGAKPITAIDRRTHRIDLTVDFTNVQTYAFVDSEGIAIAPLFTPRIEAGDVVTFECEWSTVKSKWLIYPKKNSGKIEYQQLKTNSTWGLRNLYGGIAIQKADNSSINSRTDEFKAIVPSNLNYAVTAALTDANHITLDSTQQATARQVLGISGGGGGGGADESTVKEIALIYG